MAFVGALQNLINATQPSGMWENIIFAFTNAIPNYVWAIILFTLVLKIVLSPLDFFNKKMSVKNVEMQRVIQPEIQKLEKLYGNNLQILNQKKAEVYKKHNYNVTGSCFIMLAYLVVTLVVFATLLGSLNTIASYKSQTQFEKLAMAYYQEEAYENIDPTQTVADVDAANERVREAYRQNKDSWLWIDNVWQADAPWKNSIMTYDEYKAANRITFQTDYKEGTEEVLKSAEEKETEFKAMYERIMNPLRETDGRANGFLIVAVILVGSSIISQLASQGKLKFKKKKELKNKNDKGQDQKMPGGILMTLILPLLLGYFAISYNSVFAVYMMVSSIFGFAIMPLFNWIIKKIDQKKKDKEEEIKKADPRLNYRR